MKIAKIVDGSFPHQNACGLGDENKLVHPKEMQWARDKDVNGEYTFYTDMCLEKAKNDKGKKIAMLIEPPSLSENHYLFASQNEDVFDYILTFRDDLLNLGEKWLYYPFGGSWISEDKWGMHEKSKNVSIIVSQKRGASGHKFRHSIVDTMESVYNIAVYGRGYRPVESKADAHKDFRYTIVVESWLGSSYFSEKLIDAISMGCVPIYRGCPTIEQFGFDMSGILTFTKMSELEHILAEVVCEPDYRMRFNAVKKNMDLCYEYACCEDWIASKYPWIFARTNERN